MRSAVAVSLVSATVADYQCPGSGAAIHAGLRMTSTAAADCNTVKAEMQARVNGENGWYDQHNRGTYSVGSFGGDFSASRVTGDKKYTDKMTFTLTDQGGSCQINACSESQTTSVADFGTNYCNLKLLYCGSDEGCKVANSDFKNSGESTKGSAGAGSGMDNCLKAAAMDV